MTEQYSDEQVAAAAAGFAAGEVTYEPEMSAVLPPVPDSEPMVALGIRVPPTLAQRVRGAAQQAGVPASQLIREWIEVGLTDMDNDQSVPLSALRRAIAHAAQSGQAA